MTIARPFFRLRPNSTSRFASSACLLAGEQTRGPAVCVSEPDRRPLIETIARLGCVVAAMLVLLTFPAKGEIPPPVMQGEPPLCAAAQGPEPGATRQRRSDDLQQSANGIMEYSNRPVRHHQRRHPALWRHHHSGCAAPCSRRGSRPAQLHHLGRRHSRPAEQLLEIGAGAHRWQECLHAALRRRLLGRAGHAP